MKKLLWCICIIIGNAKAQNNVGIGTAPIAGVPLTVKTQSQINTLFIDGDNSAAFQLYSHNAGNINSIGSVQLYNNNLNIFTGNPGYNANIALSTNSTPRILMDTLGRVGIGTGLPQVPLHVYLPANGELLRIDGNQPWLTMASNGETKGIIQAGINGFEFGGMGNNELQLYTAGAQRVTIDINGKVGIGTNLPQNYLHVAGGLRINGGLYLNNWPGNTGSLMQSNGAILPPTWGVAATNRAMLRGTHYLQELPVNVTISGNTLIPFTPLEFNVPGPDSAVIEFTVNIQMLNSPNGFGANITSPIYVNLINQSGQPAPIPLTAGAIDPYYGTAYTVYPNLTDNRRATYTISGTYKKPPGNYHFEVKTNIAAAEIAVIESCCTNAAGQIASRINFTVYK
jgi:hypothetical protein